MYRNLVLEYTNWELVCGLGLVCELELVGCAEQFAGIELWVVCCNCTDRC